MSAIYQNYPLSPVSFFGCRNGLFIIVKNSEELRWRLRIPFIATKFAHFGSTNMESRGGLI